MVKACILILIELYLKLYIRNPKRGIPSSIFSYGVSTPYMKSALGNDEQKAVS